MSIGFVNDKPKKKPRAGDSKDRGAQKHIIWNPHTDVDVSLHRRVRIAVVGSSLVQVAAAAVGLAKGHLRGAAIGHLRPRQQLGHIRQLANLLHTATWHSNSQTDER